MLQSQSPIRGSLSAAFLAIVSLWPTGLAVADQMPSQAGTLLSAETVRQRLVSCGFRTASGVSTSLFAVIDAIPFGRDERVFMVAVYPDLAGADRAFLGASATSMHRVSTKRGPRLFGHYGASYWLGNVAISQSSTRPLNDLWSEDAQRGEASLDVEAAARLEDILQSRANAVDPDVVDCIGGLR